MLLEMEESREESRPIARPQTLPRSLMSASACPWRCPMAMSNVKAGRRQGRDRHSGCDRKDGFLFPFHVPRHPSLAAVTEMAWTLEALRRQPWRPRVGVASRWWRSGFDQRQSTPPLRASPVELRIGSSEDLLKRHRVTMLGPERRPRPETRRGGRPVLDAIRRRCKPTPTDSQRKGRSRDAQTSGLE
ncbi:hypothetical protein BKA80DRAFT_22389 [Phyllosticta citrichinensis]